ncbi:MAG: hypothetical protein PVG39_00780 [Desulfobacteraceae bacterium]|jgi:hypothetical protein
MKQQAEVITSWIGDGSEENPNRPLIADHYSLDKWSDVTGQPSENLIPDPNSCVIFIECEDTMMDQIETDSNYFVLWVENIEESP